MSPSLLAQRALRPLSASSLRASPSLRPTSMPSSNTTPAPACITIKFTERTQTPRPLSAPPTTTPAPASIFIKYAKRTQAARPVTPKATLLPITSFPSPVVLSLHMTHLFRQLQRLDAKNQSIRVGVIGIGFMGRGLVYQLSRMPGLFPALLVNRTVNRAIDAYRQAGFNEHEIVVSDSPRILSEAVQRGKPAITSTLEAAMAVAGVDVFIEATGAVDHGARAALLAIWHKKHFVSLNAETDATVGCLLKKKADESGVVYTNSDGDQPGVLMRMIDYCRGCGFEVRSAVNCKGFMNIRATPDSIREWAVKQNTTPRMTAAFTDGTKMNIEMNVVCNAANLVPARRGMIGVKTDQKNAIADFRAANALIDRGTVDFTLAGDFGGGVFVIARAQHPEMVKPYLKYLKMGDGPDYLFYRPYHLCHVETPLSAAEAVIYHEPTIAPLGDPIAHTIAIAKRDLSAGETLDGIGGFACYGQLDEAANCEGLLPMGLAEDVTLTRPIPQDQPIPLDAVEIDESKLVVKLWREQQHAARTPNAVRMVQPA
jgi:predicted homoserine dehydrogenase-like protein